MVPTATPVYVWQVFLKAQFKGDLMETNIVACVHLR